MSSVTLAPVEVINKQTYDTVKIGDRTLFLTGEAPALSDSLVQRLLPKPKSMLPKEIHPKFKSEMGELESNGRYDIVNQLGYIGKYQFSRRTLRRLVSKGYLKASKQDIKDFRDSPEIQERAMDALIVANLETLKNYRLSKYIGRTVNGDRITLEGMLAAAHLLGPYAVKHYVQTGSLKTVYVNGVKVSKYDANGTCITKYLKHFA
jgi:hypothetical protein